MKKIERVIIFIDKDGYSFPYILEDNIWYLIDANPTFVGIGFVFKFQRELFETKEVDIIPERVLIDAERWNKAYPNDPGFHVRLGKWMSEATDNPVALWAMDQHSKWLDREEIAIKESIELADGSSYLELKIPEV